MWVRQLMELRKARFPIPNPDRWGLEGRHFVFCFHFSTIECIPRAPKATTTPEPRTLVPRMLLERLQED